MLEIYKDFFCQVNDKGIDYCSWKNNHTLAQALDGDGDIDILVSNVDRKEFEKIAFENNFICVKSSVAEYPFVQHYYCYDKSTDKFGHLHVYYKLVTGDSHLKNYRFPFENKVLRSSCMSDLGILEAHPLHQADMYMLRKYIKSSSILGLFLLFRESDDYKSEFNYIHNAVCRLDGDTCASLLGFSINFSQDASFVKLLKIKFYISAWHRGVGMVERILQLSVRTLNKVFFRRKKRINGCVIAVTGLDGSGKSSSVDMLHQWLSKEFTVRSFHFGRPPVTLLTSPIRLMLWIRKVIFSQKSSGFLIDSSADSLSLVSQIRYLALAYERLALIKRAHRFSLKGGVAILDRYPPENIGKMDGPRISNPNSSLGGLELILYKNMKIADLLLKLDVSVENAIKRNRLRAKKDKETDEEIKARFEINNKLQYEDPFLQYEINTMQPEEVVHKQLRILTWRYIARTN